MGLTHNHFMEEIFTLSDCATDEDYLRMRVGETPLRLHRCTPGARAFAGVQAAAVRSYWDGKLSLPPRRPGFLRRLFSRTEPPAERPLLDGVPDFAGAAHFHGIPDGLRLRDVRLGKEGEVGIGFSDGTTLSDVSSREILGKTLALLEELEILGVPIGNTLEVFTKRHGVLLTQPPGLRTGGAAPEVDRRDAGQAGAAAPKAGNKPPVIADEEILRYEGEVSSSEDSHANSREPLTIEPVAAGIAQVMEPPSEPRPRNDVEAGEGTSRVRPQDPAEVRGNPAATGVGALENEVTLTGAMTKCEPGWKPVLAYRRDANGDLEESSQCLITEAEYNAVRALRNAERHARYQITVDKKEVRGSGNLSRGKIIAVRALNEGRYELLDWQREVAVAALPTVPDREPGQIVRDAPAGPILPEPVNEDGRWELPKLKCASPPPAVTSATSIPVEPTVAALVPETLRPVLPEEFPLPILKRVPIPTADPIHPEF